MNDTLVTSGSLGFLLRDVSKLMRRRFIQGMREAGLELNRSEANVLMHVLYAPGINQASLAHLLGVETISIVRLIDRLQRAGLIERRPHPTDRRIRTLWLTDGAGMKVAQIGAIAHSVDVQALIGLSAEQHGRLLDLLCALKANLEAAETGEPAPAAEAPARETAQ
jgi:MarR family transcriptional regulator, transcriptional regulator for hemolysin